MINKRICLGALAGAHGVRGDALVKSFTSDPEDISAYGPLESEDGARAFTIKSLRPQKNDIFVAKIPEIKTREEALSLKGVRLYVAREALPAPEAEEFYYDDLVGLEVVDEAGAPMGRVKAVLNFGAGDLLEIFDIPGVTGVRLIPFTKEAAPDVDMAAKRVVIRPDVAGLLDEEPEEDAS